MTMPKLLPCECGSWFPDETPEGHYAPDNLSRGQRCPSCRELKLVHDRLEEGTLHLIYCNADHRSRVGREGGICCCPLGKEIKSLRRQLRLHEPFRDACVEFVRKVECYEARSKRSYREMKDAIDNLENHGPS